MNSPPGLALTKPITNPGLFCTANQNVETESSAAKQGLMARQPSEETAEQVSNLPPRRQRLSISDVMNKESESVGNITSVGSSDWKKVR